MIRLVMECGLWAWVALLLGVAALLLGFAESAMDGGIHVRPGRLARWTRRRKAKAPKHAMGKAATS